VNTKPNTSANQSHGYSAGEPWPEPVSLEQPVLPEFPIDQLPEPLRGWVSATAEATQTPVDMAALLGLTFCGASAARRVVIEAGRGWVEPINLFSASLLDPGNRKSSVFESASKPVRLVERELVAEAASEIAIARASRDVLEASRKDAMKKAAKGDSEATERVKQISSELAMANVPVQPVLLLDDATPEAVEIALNNQGGRMICAGAEGGVFDIMAGRYSGTPNIDVFLKGHAGDELRSNRVGREGFVVPNCCLSVAYAVQPDVLRGLASKQSMRGRGLMARFIYAAPKSPLGFRKIDPDPVPSAVNQAYEATIRRLLSIEDDRGKPWILQIANNAETRFRDWRGEVEVMFRNDGRLEMMKDWGGKAPGLAARIAAILHLVETQSRSPWSDFVSLRSINAAIKIVEWAIPHAEAVLAMAVADDGSVDDAIYVLRWLRQDAGTDVSRRDIQNHGRRRFDREPERLDRALKVLVDRGWIRQLESAKRPGRPSELYQVHPSVSRADQTSPAQSEVATDNDVVSDPESTERETEEI